MPAELKKLLKKRAKNAHRTLSKEVTHLLEYALRSEELPAGVLQDRRAPGQFPRRRATDPLPRRRRDDLPPPVDRAPAEAAVPARRRTDKRAGGRAASRAGGEQVASGKGRGGGGRGRK